MRRWLREPLSWFAASSAGVFLLFAILGKEATDPGRTVEITEADIERMKESFEVVWLRPPAEDELENLIEERVRDEILYREAVSMGLDRDDTVVRQRMRQALEMLASEIGNDAEPTDDELQAHLRKNKDRYLTEPRWSFRQVYFSPEKRGAATASDALKVLQDLRARSGGFSLDQLGDATLLPGQESDARASDVAAQFGQAFSEALSVAPEGEWVGPIESPYGLHIVRVDRREGGGIPPLAEVRDAVVRDWKAARADNAEAEFYTALVERYTIVVEPEESSTRAEGEPEASPGARAVGVGPHGTDPKGGSR